MHVSQVAYDRFVVELPPADAEWRPLADPDTVAETAAWLWDFGPKPLIAVVGFHGSVPGWLSGWAPRSVRWSSDGLTQGAALVLHTRVEVERFLSEGAPHEHTMLLWPSHSDAKVFEALSAGGSAWTKAVDAHAKISNSGERFDLQQVEQP